MPSLGSSRPTEQKTCLGSSSKVRRNPEKAILNSRVCLRHEGQGVEGRPVNSWEAVKRKHSLACKRFLQEKESWRGGPGKIGGKVTAGKKDDSREKSHFLRRGQEVRGTAIKGYMYEGMLCLRGGSNVIPP